MAQASIKKPTSKQRARKLKPVKGRFFGLVQKSKYKLAIPSAYRLFKQSNRHIWQHRKLFGGIWLVYLVLTLLLVRGFGLTTDLGLAKESFQELFTGAGSAFSSSLAVLGYLIGTNSPTSEVAVLYQSIIIIIVSLAVIWALRQTYAKGRVTVKDSFYKSMYPLIPFLIVLLVIGLQSIPMIAGSFLFSTTIGTGIAEGLIQKMFFGAISFALVLWTAYMVSSSIFALYIVTLPDMWPLAALRSAKKMVRYRRWTILRKVLFLPFVMGVLIIAIMLPTIMFIAPISEVVFVLLFSTTLIVVHGYMYALYRELL